MASIQDTMQVPGRSGQDVDPVVDVHVVAGLEIGHAALACGRAVSEDFFDVACPSAPELDRRGLVLALADGLSGPGAGGRRAAETCVRAAVGDYYATPAAWDVPRALDRVVGSVNAWLLAHNQRNGETQSMISTLSVLVLRGDRFFVAHVGDTRIYRLRDRTLERLTTDHVWARKDMRQVLRRAVGLDEHLVMEFTSGRVRAGDVFVMATDGVWEVLGDDQVHELARAEAAPGEIAARLVRSSLERQRTYYGRNDATAAVIRIRRSPPSCDGAGTADPAR
ncbi:MAG: serine/threonine-protein phosphatase [Gammaproteobacteria bacterium]|nr:serine/threonine-protein phosphatase [Gammaproteobacteria bacterium]